MRNKDDREVLGARGRRLWGQVTQADPNLTPVERALLEEACRCADRLERIDELIRMKGSAWAHLRSLNEDGTVTAVVLDGIMMEARQQQLAFKGLLGELRAQQQARAVKQPQTPKPGQPAQTASTADDGQPNPLPPGVSSLAARAHSRAAGARAQG